jgi:5-methylcytosine-specific restriction endonuclease McrA
MDKSKYQKYVKTDCWSLRRQQYLKGHTSCEACGQRIALQVHHLTYERLGSERDDDLLAVCENCHRMFHGMDGATPKTWAVQRLSYLPEGPKKELVFRSLEDR